VVAIVPAHLLPTEQESEPVVEAIPVLNGWVRGALVGITLGLVIVFSIAVWLNPYNAGGEARRMETHRQLGLPPCTFKTVTGIPCPSCGMTTSFALLMHGDVWNSLKANAVGTLLALFCLALIPWNLACAYCGRPFFIVSLERALTRIILVFLVLMLTRWAIVLGVLWWHGALHWPDWKHGGPIPTQARRRDDGYTDAAALARRPGCAGAHPGVRLQPVAVALLHRGRRRGDAGAEVRVAGPKEDGQAQARSVARRDPRV
jgi:hypothetical protein